jgi:hypothetical protein
LDVLFYWHFFALVALKLWLFADFGGSQLLLCLLHIVVLHVDTDSSFPWQLA